MAARKRERAMSESVVVGLLSLVGTVVGTLGGIWTTQRLTTYKIEQLQKEVAKHNGLVERTYRLEGQMAETQHEIRDIKTRLDGR